MTIQKMKIKRSGARRLALLRVFQGEGARGNLLLLMAGLTLINLVFYGIYFVKLLAPAQASFFYDPLESYAGIFGDFFNPVHYVYHLNPLEHQWSNAPPFLHFFCYIASLPMRLFTGEQGGIAMALTPAGLVGFGLLAVAMVAALAMVVNFLTRPLLNRRERCWLCLTTAVSYPVFFSIAGGNLALLAAVCIGLFLMAYEKAHYMQAAVWLGIASALKLYPALLGVLFLCDKRWREALACAATGVGLTWLSLAVFREGVVANLLDFLQKAESYNVYGNLDLRRIMMNNNALLMLTGIPFYITSGGAATLEEMALHNEVPRAILTALLALSIGSCFWLRRRQDRVLLLSLWMVAYPYNSEPYNLTLVIVPLVYWLCRETKKNTPMIVMGVLLLMCKTHFAIYATNVRHITLQSALNPLLILGMLLWLYCLRREEAGQLLKSAWARMAGRRGE